MGEFVTELVSTARNMLLVVSAQFTFHQSDMSKVTSFLSTNNLMKSVRVLMKSVRVWVLKNLEITCRKTRFVKFKGEKKRF